MSLVLSRFHADIELLKLPVLPVQGWQNAVRQQVVAILETTDGK